MNNVSQHYGVGSAYYAAAKGFLASLECEIEGLSPGDCAKIGGNWKAISDNSLRNSGAEFINSTGKSTLELMEDFRYLQATLKPKPELDPFSQRTSTHVHVNVCNIAPEQVRTLVLLYALYEELFFAMVHPCRRDNIHCVPLTETAFPKNYRERLDGMLNMWHKYTALNLKRLTDLGTVEFRHHHGTGDAEELGRWVQVLENLWKLSQQVTLNADTLSDKRNILKWYEVIFSPSPKIMALQGSLFSIIQNSLIDVKFSTIL